MENRVDASLTPEAGHDGPSAGDDPGMVLMDRQDLEEAAQQILALVVGAKQDVVIEAGAASIPWKVGMALLSDTDERMRLLALALALGAVVQTPDALITAVRGVHTNLAAMAPRLEVPTLQQAGSGHP